MESHLQLAGVRAVELSWYGLLAGVLVSVATFRYRKAPQFMVLGMGIGSGIALI